MDEYVVGRPHPGLAGVALAYGGYDEHSVAPVRRRQAPTGFCTLILAWDGPLRLEGPRGVRSSGPFLAGMHDAAVVTAFTGRQQGVQVDLSPLGVLRLLGRPVDDLTDDVPALDELDLPALAALPGRLAEDGPGRGASPASTRPCCGCSTGRPRTPTPRSPTPGRLWRSPGGGYR